MVRSGARRSAKYGKKITHGAARYMSAQKAHFRAKIGRQVEIEQKVKQIIEGASVPVMLNHFYMDFGKEVNRAAENYTGPARLLEIRVLQEKWAGRGLDVAVLDAIKAMFVVVGMPFRLDHSLFDGPDVLV